MIGRGDHDMDLTKALGQEILLAAESKPIWQPT